MKREPWRITVAIVSVVFIIFMWVKKDIGAVYSTMPAEQIVPLVATTVFVTLIKVATITGVFFIIKWIIGKIKRKQLLKLSIKG